MARPADPLAVVDEYVRAAPVPALRPYIAWYSGYRQRGLAPALHRGLPSPYLTLIFTLDEPLTVVGHPDPRQAPGGYDTLLGGLHTSPALIAHDGAQSGVQVALRPLGARALLGLPAGELAQHDLPADAVLGRVCEEARERMRAASGWAGTFAVLDDILSRRSGHRVSAVDPEIAEAWAMLERARGSVPVVELAAEVGWSTRHLRTRFRTEIGLTPKAAARVIRFDHARRLLGRRAAAVAGAGGPGELALADLAAGCGYFDQAHLAREFRALAGAPPSRWLAEEAGYPATGRRARAENIGTK
ncbi:helix-turn-helix domain-containing protein [Parafrankia discariae]|uniref:helix-turn-helix domain-containing protein n=1 Tax=Parafrankia discariae TaxID=365528 RepID=UPI0004777B2E|nr:helix-turn-helix domain-containing protein [Parafrankia discariae]